MSANTKKYTMSVLDSFARAFNEQKDLKKTKRVFESDSDSAKEEENKILQKRLKKKRRLKVKKGIKTPSQFNVRHVVKKESVKDEDFPEINSVESEFKTEKYQEMIEAENNFFSNLSFKNPFIFGIPIAIISVIITLLGADITVDSAINISKFLNISDSFIGLTIIAIGTSLPEIATSINAAKRGKSNIIIGNIIGSNIYNLLLILGFTSLFESFSYDKNMLSTDVIFLNIAVILFTFIIFKRIIIGRNLSLICFLIYCAYLAHLYIKNF